MLKKLNLENIIAGNTAAGVEIILLPDEKYEINVVVLKKDKSILTTEKQYQGLTNFEELAKTVGTKLPIVLLLNGKGIIHKKVSINGNDTETSLLNKVLPNAKMNEFTIQQTDISSEQAFISIIRYDVLNEVIEELKKNKLGSISNCFLGSFVINGLLPFINEQLINSELLTVSNYQFQIREQQITDITIVESADTSSSMQIGTDSVPQTLIFAFAAAFSYFTGNNGGISNAEQVTHLIKEFNQRKRFEFFGVGLLVTTFVILIINFFVFNYYWNKNKDLNPQLVQNDAALKRYDLLKKEYDQKKELLEENGLLEDSRTSYYADQIVSCMPLSILLSDLSIHPLKKKKANEDGPELFFETKTITIAGRCQQSTELNNWMKELKKKTWLLNVKLSNYKKDNETDDGLFLIELKLK